MRHLRNKRHLRREKKERVGFNEERQAVGSLSLSLSFSPTKIPMSSGMSITRDRNSVNVACLQHVLLPAAPLSPQFRARTAIVAPIQWLLRCLPDATSSRQLMRFSGAFSSPSIVSEKEGTMLRAGKRTGERNPTAQREDHNQ